MKKILITGCSGFIGFHLSKELLKNYKIIGIDSLEKKKFVNIAKDRTNELKKNKNFTFKKINISEFKKLELIFKKNKFYMVINLAAPAGVRPAARATGAKVIPATPNNVRSPPTFRTWKNTENTGLNLYANATYLFLIFVGMS